MNIVEAYIKYMPQLVIFVSGISGCGKTNLAKRISDGFNINFMEQQHYIKKDYDTQITLPDGTQVVNSYTDDAVDWDRLNKDLSKLKHQGVVLSGFALVDDKIKTKPDYHIHLSLSKQTCMEKRRKYLEKNKKKYPDEYKLINTPAEKLKMNQLIFPYYLDTKKRSTINKVLNINDMSNEEIYDAAWDTLIEFIKSVNDEHYHEWINRQESEEEDLLDEPTAEQDDEEESVEESEVKPMIEPTEEFPEEEVTVAEDSLE